MIPYRSCRWAERWSRVRPSRIHPSSWPCTQSRSSTVCGNERRSFSSRLCQKTETRLRVPGTEIFDPYSRFPGFTKKGGLFREENLGGVKIGWEVPDHFFPLTKFPLIPGWKGEVCPGEKNLAPSRSF